MEKTVAKFKDEIKKGPFYLSVVWNKTFYKQTV